MFQNLDLPTTDNSDKYGVPISCRIPASLHKEIGNEAALRGISMSRYLTSLLQTGHQQEASRNADINILLKEKESLQKEVQGLKLEVEKLEQKMARQSLEEPYFGPLRRNLELLQKHYPASSVLVATLVQDGFDFTFVTQTVMIHEQQYFCILDMGYRQVGDKIFIKRLTA